MKQINLVLTGFTRITVNRTDEEVAEKEKDKEKGRIAEVGEERCACSV